jgi:hypothetical protein
MSKPVLNYQRLFEMLRSLDFEQQASINDSNLAIFFHAETNTLLAFKRREEELVTAADLLSTEVHLHSKGIIHEPLEALLSTATTR